MTNIKVTWHLILGNSLFYEFITPQWQLLYIHYRRIATLNSPHIPFIHFVLVLHSILGADFAAWNTIVMEQV